MLFTTRLKLRPLNLADARAIHQLAVERLIADTTISIPLFQFLTLRVGVEQARCDRAFPPTPIQ
ncbi:MAG: hypothetical protein AAGF83_09815 [Cyanobacteria bacterium P01_G01_bin.67]